MKTPKTLLLVVAVAAGCHKAPPDSQEFKDAFQLYNQLYASSLDDSYSDPRMLRVAELLKKVDPTAEQAGEAKDLLAKVEKGIADAKARTAQSEADQRAAEAPVKFVGGTAFEQPPGPPNDGGGSAAGPALGMTRDEFTSKFGDCFEKRGEYEQGDRRGEAFGLMASCTSRFPTFTDSIVVLIDNKVASLVPMKEVTVRTVDAGPPAASPTSPAAAATTGEPPPTRVKYFPGGPVPQPTAGTPPPASP